MKANEIAARLASEVDGVVYKLLPKAKRKGKEFQVGSVHGEAGKSLCICAAGTKAGVWSDFAEGIGGDLLDLWAQVYGLSIAEAITEAKSYLNIAEPNFERKEKKYIKPEKPKCHQPQNRVMDFLKTERNLSDEAIQAYKVAEQGDYVLFPSLREGKLVRYKMRHVDDKHNCQTSSDSEPCLFGWQAIPVDAREVVICEGEIDALSWYQLGYPALSLPSGAQSMSWIEVEYEYLERFDKIYLSMDMDESGQKAIPEIIERLGQTRVRVVKLNAKDANELLLNGETNARKFIDQAKTVDPKELKSAEGFAEEVIREFYGEAEQGIKTPWEKVGDKLLFRRGEVIVFAGYNKHGKSQAVGHITLDAIAQGERACIASLEFKPAKWLARLVRQATSAREPTKDFIRAVHTWYDNRLWVFDVTGKGKAQRMLEVFRYARKRYGITFYVIDNLQKLDIKLDDYEQQRNFIDELTDFAKETDSTVFLVHHMRKGENESQPGKMDIKGSSAITDLVDTIIVWWRNKKKEQERKDAEFKKEFFDETKQPDAMLYCEGQRNGEDEPNVRLWFDTESMQFLERAGQKPTRYVQFSIVKTESA